MPFWKPFIADFLNPAERGGKADTSTAAGKSGHAESEMHGVHFEQSRDGLREWLLTAARLYSTGTDSDMELEDVRAIFYGRGGQKEQTLIRSRRARSDAEGMKITLREKVVIENDRGYEMQTESLEYLASEKKARTTSAVSIRGKNLQVSGQNLLYETVTRDFTLKGNVVCRIW